MFHCGERRSRRNRNLNGKRKWTKQIVSIPQQKKNSHRRVVNPDGNCSCNAYSAKFHKHNETDFLQLVGDLRPMRRRKNFFPNEDFCLKALLSKAIEATHQLKFREAMFRSGLDSLLLFDSLLRSPYWPALSFIRLYFDTALKEKHFHFIRGLHIDGISKHLFIYFIHPVSKKNYEITV